MHDQHNLCAISKHYFDHRNMAPKYVTPTAPSYIDINLKEYRSWVCGQNLALFIYICPSSNITE